MISRAPGQRFSSQYELKEVPKAVLFSGWQWISSGHYYFYHLTAGEKGALCYCKLSEGNMFEVHLFPALTLPLTCFLSEEPSWWWCKACCPSSAAVRYPRGSSPALHLPRKRQKLSARGQGIYVLVTSLLTGGRDSTKSALPTGDISGTEAT